MDLYSNGVRRGLRTDITVDLISPISPFPVIPVGLAHFDH